MPERWSRRRQIARAVNGRAKLVGVFVNAARDYIKERLESSSSICCSSMATKTTTRWRDGRCR